MAFFRICTSIFFGLGAAVGLLLFFGEREYIVFWAVDHGESNT